MIRVRIVGVRPVNKTLLFVLGIIAIVILLFTGLMPLPGQKDNVTIHNQPSPPGQKPAAPKGPPAAQPPLEVK
jgi:hypothetical protein